METTLITKSREKNTLKVKIGVVSKSNSREHLEYAYQKVASGTTPFTKITANYV